VFAGLVAGDTVTFRGASVAVTINRKPKLPDRPQFTACGVSIVFLNCSSTFTPPRSGEYFTEASGTKHKIKTVEPHDGFGFECECEVIS
jgi:hypothetical protein